MNSTIINDFESLQNNEKLQIFLKENYNQFELENIFSNNKNIFNLESNENNEIKTLIVYERRREFEIDFILINAAIIKNEKSNILRSFIDESKKICTKIKNVNNFLFENGFKIHKKIENKSINVEPIYYFGFSKNEINVLFEPEINKILNKFKLEIKTCKKKYKGKIFCSILTKKNANHNLIRYLDHLMSCKGNLNVEFSEEEHYYLIKSEAKKSIKLSKKIFQPKTIFKYPDIVKIATVPNEKMLKFKEYFKPIFSNISASTTLDYFERVINGDHSKKTVEISENLLKNMFLNMKVDFLNESVLSHKMVFVLIGIALHTNLKPSYLYSINKIMSIKHKRRACDGIYSHGDKIILFEFKNNATHNQDSLKYILDRDYLLHFLSYSKEIEPSILNEKKFITTIGIEAYGGNEGFKIKLHIGNDINIQSHLNKTEQYLNNIIDEDIKFMEFSPKKHKHPLLTPKIKKRKKNQTTIKGLMNNTEKNNIDFETIGSKLQSKYIKQKFKTNKDNTKLTNKKRVRTDSIYLKHQNEINMFKETIAKSENEYVSKSFDRNDTKKILQFYGQNFSKFNTTMREWVKKNENVGCILNTKIISMLTYSVFRCPFECIDIFLIATDINFRRKGIGKKLIQSLSINKFIVWSDYGSVDFYSSLSFVENESLGNLLKSYTSYCLNSVFMCFGLSNLDIEMIENWFQSQPLTT